MRARTLCNAIPSFGFSLETQGPLFPVWRPPAACCLIWFWIWQLERASWLPLFAPCALRSSSFEDINFTSVDCVRISRPPLMPLTVVAIPVDSCVSVNGLHYYADSQRTV